MAKLLWQIKRWWRQNWIWYKCDECGRYKVFNRIKTRAIFGDVWCEKCFMAYVGVYD